MLKKAEIDSKNNRLHFLNFLWIVKLATFRWFALTSYLILLAYIRWWINESVGKWNTISYLFCDFSNFSRFLCEYFVISILQNNSISSQKIRNIQWFLEYSLYGERIRDGNAVTLFLPIWHQIKISFSYVDDRENMNLRFINNSTGLFAL